MIEAVLLDLDNTMVLFDETTYVERYFERLTPWFSDLYSKEALQERVLSATAGLRENKGLVSNRDFFLDRFGAAGNGEREDIWNRFLEFYENDYAGIQVPVSTPAGLQEVLGQLARSSLKVVLASNPVFPRIAQETRMGWGGIDAGQFDLFTHIENMAFVKPNVAYYRQICDMLRTPPRACLMVGNDPEADMAAGQAGLKTYLTSDAAEAGCATLSLTARTPQKDAAAAGVDFAGPFAGVSAAVEKLNNGLTGSACQADPCNARSIPVDIF